MRFKLPREECHCRECGDLCWNALGIAGEDRGRAAITVISDDDPVMERLVAHIPTCIWHRERKHQGD